MTETVNNLPAMEEAQVPSLDLEDPWIRKWQPTPAFLPGKAHGQRSLAGYSPCVRKESDTTEHLSTAQTRAKPHSMPVSIIITLKLAAILLFMVMASI